MNKKLISTPEIMRKMATALIGFAHPLLRIAWVRSGKWANLDKWPFRSTSTRKDGFWFIEDVHRWSVDQYAHTSLIWSGEFDDFYIPGIGTMSSPLWWTHANASWFKEHFLPSATFWTRWRISSFFVQFSPMNLGWCCTIVYSTTRVRSQIAQRTKCSSA